MMPLSANGSPNRVASRGTAFSRKNMTTKVGAARISPMADAAAPAMTPPARRAKASSRPSARPTAMAMTAISKFTAMPPRNSGRKSDDSRSSNSFMTMPPPGAAREARDVGERAQKLGRADEARDRRALGGIDQEGHDLGRRAAESPGEEIHPAGRPRPLGAQGQHR